MEIKPIAYIYTDFKEKFGIPRQSGRVKSVTGKIVFEKQFRNPDALRGIEEFSHLWLIFDFSLNHREEWSPTVRPPRMGGNSRIGVFASRAPFRPNNIGLSCVELERKEETDDGTVLFVKGADILDGTPIFDIKPYIPYCDCVEGAEGSYSEDFKDYRLDVVFQKELLSRIPKEKRDSAVECLAEDIRPSYQDDGNRIYKWNFADFNISFYVKNNTVFVVDVE